MTQARDGTDVHGVTEFEFAEALIMLANWDSAPSRPPIR